MDRLHIHLTPLAFIVVASCADAQESRWEVWMFPPTAPADEDWPFSRSVRDFVRTVNSEAR